MAGVAQEPVVVIDNGSFSIKAGMAGDDAPKVVFPTVVGKPIHRGAAADMDTRTAYVGDDAQIRPERLNLYYPLEKGTICDWENMERVWRHTLHRELRVDPEQTGIVLTEPPLNPKVCREKMAETMFESFNAKSVCISAAPVLSAYSTGRTNALVVDISDTTTRIVPIYEGFYLPPATTRMDIGGRDITQYLMDILTAKGYSLNSRVDRDAARDIKETLCYACRDMEKEMFRSRDDSVEKIYEMPDGKKILVGTERFRCVEPLFNPFLLGLETPGIQRVVYSTIIKLDKRLQSELFQNIILSGGGTMFNGMSDRLLHDIKKLAAPDTKVKVIGTHERNIAVWIGGSIIGCLDSFNEISISKQEYHEVGPHLVHTKCF